jgi:hypothetical protein
MYVCVCVICDKGHTAVNGVLLQVCSFFMCVCVCMYVYVLYMFV